MIYKDLKIGLILGLVLVVIIVLRLATNPDLSPESRWQLYNTTDVGDNTVSSEDNVSRDLISGEITLDSEKQKFFQSEYAENIVAQNEKLRNIFSADKPEPQTKSVEPALNSDATDNEQKEPLENGITSPSETILDEPDVEIVAQEQTDNKQLEEDESFNYKEPEIIKAEKFYIVRKNQTLSEISSLYYGSANKWQKIVDANPDVIKDPNKIKAGMKLIIPD
jgi:LysM repeat protein